MNFEIFKERLKTDKLAKAISSKLGDDYETSVSLFEHDEDGESYMIVSVGVARLDEEGKRVSLSSTRHYFNVHMSDDTTVNEVYLEMFADRAEVNRLPAIYDALMLRLQLDFDDRSNRAIEHVKEKIIELANLDADRADEIIKLAKEIDLIFSNDPIFGSVKDDRILKEVQKILHLAEKIKHSISLHEPINSDQFRSIVIAKLRLLQIV